MNDLTLSRVSELFDELEVESRVFISSVERIQTPICPLNFHREYVAPNRPVIIDGLSKNWNASSKWNLDYFRSVLGDDICQISFRMD